MLTPYLMAKRFNFAMKRLVEKVVEHNVLLKECFKIFHLSIAERLHFIMARISRFDI